MYNMFVYLYMYMCIYIYSVYMYIYIEKQGKRVREGGTRWARGKRKDCHGALALRKGALTGAVQQESRLQEDASKMGASSAGRQANWRFGASFLSVSESDVWQSGLLAACKTQQASWKLAVQNGRQRQGLELVSSQFRQWRLAVWAAGRGSRSVLHCHCCFSHATRSLDPSCARRKLVAKRSKCKTKASCKTQQASWKLAVQNGRQRQGLELVSSQFRKWRVAVWAAGRGSWSVLHYHCVLALRQGPWTWAVQDESQLQDAASKLEAGSAERQAKARFGASF